MSRQTAADATTMSEPLLFNAQGAAAVLCMSVRSLERLAASGELRSVKLGGLRRYRRVDLEAFVDGLGNPDGRLAALSAQAAHHARRGAPAAQRGRRR